MHRPTLLLAAAAISLSSLLPAPALAEETDKAASGSGIAWTYVTPEDGREHLWESLSWSSATGQLIAIEKTVRDGRFSLVRFTADGKLIDSVRIDQRPTGLDVSHIPREIAGVVPLSDGRLLVIGSMDVEAGVELVWSTARAIACDRPSCRSQNSPSLATYTLQREHSILLVGSAETGAFALEVSLEGDVLWHKQYRQGKPNRYAETRLALVEEFEAVALQPDGKSLTMVGISGELNEFGLGPADVWLVALRRRGKGSRSADHSRASLRFSRACGWEAGHLHGQEGAL